MEDILSAALRNVIRDAVREALPEHSTLARGNFEQHDIAHRTPGEEPPTEMPEIMSTQSLATHLELDPKALERWRKTWPNGERLGPQWLRPPGTKLYRYYRRDVIEWLDSGLSGKRLQ